MDGHDLIAQPLSQTELLTMQFYDWEQRGRGWQVWPWPVELEPPFRPFFGHAVNALPAADDARKPTLLSSAVETIRGWFGPRPSQPPVLEILDGDEWFEPFPQPDRDPSGTVEFELGLPDEFATEKETAEQFLLNLCACRSPIGFELVGLPERILAQYVCRGPDASQLGQQLAAHFPETVLNQHHDLLRRHWNFSDDMRTVIADFGLSREFMLPLRTARQLDRDPLTGFVGSLSELRSGQLGILQVLFTPVRHPWAESIYRSVTNWDGSAFFADASGLPQQSGRKIGFPLYSTIIRVAAQADSEREAWHIVRNIAGGLRQFADPVGNELIPLANDEYPEEAHGWDLLTRRSRRSGMILNSDELVSLVHPPSERVRSPKFQRLVRRTKAAPAIVTREGILLGHNQHHGQVREVRLTAEQRSRHVYEIGASGSGKSTHFLSMLGQDIAQGQGVAVLDPHGDLIEQVLARIPDERADDVVLFDPADEDFPVGFNILQAHTELEKQLLASDLVAVFRRLSTSWGDQMTSVLGNAILAFLESTHGGTLSDLRRFLVEREFRQTFLETVTDPEIIYYWQREFPLLTGKPQAPLLTRLDTFLRPKLVRHIVAQKQNKLDFAQIMNSGKIFLGKLAQGAIGEENAHLLGTLLVSKFHQIALARQELAQAERRPFYLYIDEFHNFITPSMAQILSGARKYRLGLVLAHQDLRQLTGRDSDVASAVYGAGTRICFRLGDEDARKLADGFSAFEARDLQNLSTGEAICRVERSEYDFTLKTAPLSDVNAELAASRRDRAVAWSRQRYATPRELVETELVKQRSRTAPPEVKADAKPSAAAEGTRDESLGSSASQHSHPASPLTPPPRQPDAAPPGAQTPPVEPLPQPAAAATPRAQRPAVTPIPPPPPPLGRGGAKHKYLQNLIKQWAEGMGWRATIEQQILDGAGQVDVALEKGPIKVACEISVTSSVEQELGNIEKCLKAGFPHVAVVSNEPKWAGSMQRAVSKKWGQVDERIHCFSAQELFAFIERLEAQAASKEVRIKGRRVKVSYELPESDGKVERARSLSRVLARTFGRHKNDQ